MINEEDEIPSQEECDIRIIMAQFTETFENAEGEWPVDLRIGNQFFRINEGCESLEHANWFREQMAKALLNFLKLNHKKERCADCSKKIRADWY